MPGLIDSQAQLDGILPLLQDAPALALDTETDSFFAYRPKVCLLQVSVDGHDFLIDPLAGLDLAPLGALVADPARETVLHAAENDVILLKHEYGWSFGRLYDTQVAAMVLGLKPYSLAGILEARFGVRLDKKEQRSDWSRRPLRPAQTEYAVEDTRHLLELARELQEHAAHQGRTEEIAVECARIAGRDWEPEAFDPESYHRIAGARDLDGVGRRILRDLYLLRHAEAERRNVAAFRIAADNVLATIARERRTEPGRGVPETFWRRYGHRVAGLVAQARERGPLPRQARRSGRSAPPPPVVRARYERLRRWRTTAATARGVETFIVARNDLLMQIAQADPRTPEALRPLLEPFRFEEYGAAILAALLAETPDHPDNSNQR